MAGAGCADRGVTRSTRMPGAADGPSSRRWGLLIVVKASGLAAGKGAVVCGTVAEAVETAREMFSGAFRGSGAARVVIEEYMEGEELSVFYVAHERGLRAPPPLAGPQADRRGRHRAEYGRDGRLRPGRIRDRCALMEEVGGTDRGPGARGPWPKVGAPSAACCMPD